METKICIKCNKEKNIEEFYFRKDWNKHINTCNECLKKYISLYCKTDKRKKYKKNYRENNKQLIKEYNQYYYKKNNKELTIYRKEHYKKRKQKDSLYLFKMQIRGIVTKSFLRKGYTKNSKSIQVLGCDWESFYSYLLQTFKNNYGYEWDKKEKVCIDHIIPLSTAKTEEEVIKLCHYTNLQLLKEKDNLEKGQKLNWKL